MNKIVSDDEFVKEYNNCGGAIEALRSSLKSQYPNFDVRINRMENRIARLRKHGKLPLDSNNSVGIGETLKGTSTLFGPDGSIKQQWIKTDVAKENFFEGFREALNDIVIESLKPLPVVAEPTSPFYENLATMYLSNDVHIGALMWKDEVGTTWDLTTAITTFKAAYDYLLDASPPSKIAIVTDLGDITEIDDYKNMTPKSGNILDVSGRYPQILRAAYESLIYGVNKALTKHETVYFYNVAGNHDISTGMAIQEVMRVAFQDNPRVIVNESPCPIKYHQHGTTLLQFAHGDGLTLKDAGEVMAHDCSDIFSSTTHRYAHFGHTHKTSVVDGKLCKAESHRNLAPLNHWAFHKGFRGPLGTMKSITYSTIDGEISRQTFNVNML